MGIKTLIMILASLSFSVSAFADHHEGGEKKPFSIYGDTAASISFFDNENNGGNHDAFNVDLIEINLEKNWSKSKLHLSIGYGSTAQAVNTLTTLSANTLNVMNAAYSMQTSYGLGFLFGKFESPVGHETYNQMDNVNYSRSYGFNLAPFFSTGLAVDYGSDMWKAGFIVSNGSGMDTDTRDNNKTMAVVFDVDPMDNLHFDLNYVTGTEGNGTNFLQVNTLDFSVSYMVNEMFDVAFNYIDHGQKATTTGATDEKANSMAVYGNASFGMFGLGLRYEMFSYDDGVVFYNGLAGTAGAPTGTDNEITAITLTARAEIDQNAMVVLEYKMDSSDDEIWTDADGAATDSMSVINAALMYRF